MICACYFYITDGTQQQVGASVLFTHREADRTECERLKEDYEVNYQT